MPKIVTSSPESFPVTYKGYAIYQKIGAAVWEKNPVSGHEYVVDHKPGSGFSIVRVDPKAPPVLHSHAGTFTAAKGYIDFMLKFPYFPAESELEQAQVA